MARELGISVDEYHSLLKDSLESRLFSFEEMLNPQHDGPGESFANDDPGPNQNFEREAFLKALSDAINNLPEREKLVLALYYDEELNLKEIGQVLGVSESRVSQIHSQAALRLRSRLSDWR